MIGFVCLAGFVFEMIVIVIVIYDFDGMRWDAMEGIVGYVLKNAIPWFSYIHLKSQVPIAGDIV